MRRAQNARDLTHLCQRCGGDLAHVHARFAADDEWHCEQCGAVWTYARDGWQFLMEGSRDGKRSPRR